MMNQAMRLLVPVCVVLTLTLAVQEQAEAQRRGGRSGTGTYQRTGPQGRTGSGTWTRARQTERGQGYRQTRAEGSATSESGRQRSWLRNSRTERTGEGTYSRQWDRTTTNARGESRTWTGEGEGRVERTDSGHTRTYEGTTTAPNGNQYDVSRSTDRQKTDTGWEKTSSKTVTDQDGNTVYQGDRSATGVQGEGVTREGNWSTAQGSGSYTGSSVRTEDGVEHDRQWQNSRGREGSGTATWQYQDGQWVRVYRNSRGVESEFTVDEDD